jgi:hypothetical protein
MASGRFISLDLSTRIAKAMMMMDETISPPNSGPASSSQQRHRQIPQDCTSNDDNAAFLVDFDARHSNQSRGWCRIVAINMAIIIIMATCLFVANTRRLDSTKVSFVDDDGIMPDTITSQATGSTTSSIVTGEPLPLSPPPSQLPTPKILPGTIDTLVDLEGVVETTMAAGALPETVLGNIVEVAASDKKLSTWSAALTAAGLNLSGEGLGGGFGCRHVFTVFGTQ